MAYNQEDYSFTRKTRNNSNSRWIEVLMALRYAPLTKRELMHRVWGFSNVDMLTPNLVVDAETQRYVVRGFTDVCRGRSSHLFGCMHSANLISYDIHTRKWSITDEGKRKLYYGMANANC